tara:strand:+ start:1539 stop:1718 length:180 start_codon:yes stop_codon:yes gene_type:complete
MNQNFQTLVNDPSQNTPSSIESLLIGGVLVFLNLFVMFFVGLYWMNPVMHEFISGRPLL